MIQALYHLTDVIYFGVLSPCPICKTGKIAFRNGIYCCTGYDSAWSTCSYTVKEPKRTPIDLRTWFQHQQQFGGNPIIRTRLLRSGIQINDEDFE